MKPSTHPPIQAHPFLDIHFLNISYSKDMKQIECRTEDSWVIFFQFNCRNCFLVSLDREGVLTVNDAVRSLVKSSCRQSGQQYVLPTCSVLWELFVGAFLVIFCRFPEHHLGIYGLAKWDRPRFLGLQVH